MIRHGMITYPGLPAPEVGEYLSREASRARYDAHWGTGRYAVDSPFLTSEAAAWLAAEGAALVGIDSLNIDDTDDLTRPAHTRLLAAGIPIVEHLCGLDQLPPRGFRFHAAPPLFLGVGTFPVRAYAVIGA